MAYFILCAGGTGGHLFPAQALSEVLQRRGHTVDLMTDERAEQYGVSFPARRTHIVPSATFSPRNLFQAVPGALTLARGTLKALGVMFSEKPAAVIGFGGYPTLPPMFAGRLRGVPVILHEQNAVLGRANAALASHANMIATSFANTEGIPTNSRAIVIHVGNPVRSKVLVAARTPYKRPRARDPFELLVFGGSQGARVFADLVPGALEQFSEEDRKEIHITQQCRAEDIARVREAYENLGIQCDLAAFFVDMPERMAKAHLVISRSGASTVSELAVLGRPSILVPYPHALDHDQARNAKRLEDAGGAILALQKNMGPVRLSQVLARLMDPASQELDTMAKAAREAGRPMAVEQMAVEIEAIAL